MKVLISAYACEPHKGSEPGVGWNWVKQIAKFAEAWVITRSNNKAIIEKELKNNPEPNLHFIYTDLPVWLRFWKKGEMSIRIYYNLWQLRAYFRAKQLHKMIKFDLIHHITFLVDWLPAYTGFLPIPFVWGPIGGTDTVLHINFLREFGFWNSLYEISRFISLNVWSKIDPLLAICKQRAAAILVSTELTMDAYAKRCGDKVYLLSAIGINENEMTTHSVIKDGRPFTLFTAGRHVHWKGHSLVLKAYSNFAKKYPDSILYVAGKGPMTKKLRNLSAKLSLNDNVKFLGFLPNRDALFRILAECDVFILPTLRDAPLVSFLEAMLVRVPIICLDTPGQMALVTAECGIKVKPVTLEQTIDDLVHALIMLADNPELRRQMGEAGRRRIMEHYTWEKKGEFITKIYEDVLKK